MPPGLQESDSKMNPKGPRKLRILTEGTVNDDDVLLGDEHETPLGPVSPDGYPETSGLTGDEGGVLDNHQNIDIIDSDNELDDVDNDIVVVLRGNTVDGSGGGGDGDDDVVHDIDAMVDVAQTVGTAVGEHLLSQPGDDLMVEDIEDVDEFEIIENDTAGKEQ